MRMMGRKLLSSGMLLYSICWQITWAGGTPDGLDYQPPRVATVGDPVSVGSGEEQLSFPLYNLPGPMPIELTLFYQSQSAQASDLIGGFYLGIPQLWSDGTAFKISALHGMDSIEFDPGTGGWKANDKSAWPYEAKSAGTNYFVLSPADETVYFFESINAGIALCRKKTDRAGRSLYYNYATYGNRYLPAIASISNEFGMCVDISMGNLSGDYWAVTSMCSRAEGAAPWLFKYVNNGFQGDYYVLSTMQNPAGDTIRLNYWTNSQCITSVQLPRGNVPYASGYEAVTVIGFQTKKVVTAQTNALGGVTTLSYDFDAGRTIEVRPDGLTNIYGSVAYTTEYSRAAGSPDFMTFAGGMSLQFGQDAAGNITNTVTSTGASMSKGYDAESGRMNSLTVGTNTLIDVSFTTVTQSCSGLHGELADFEFRNETGRSYPGGITESLEYDASGNTTGMVDTVGQRWSYQYDAHGLLTNTVNPLGGVEQSSYNEKGWLVSQVDAAFGTNTLEYDYNGYVVRGVDAEGSVTAWGYDAMGRVLAETNALGQVKRYTYDRNGNVLSETSFDGNVVVARGYNDMDKLTHLTNALGQRHILTYDVMGRISTIVGPDNITNYYRYDPDGHVTNKVRGSYVWSGAYNADGLLINQSASGEPDYTFVHDDAGRVIRKADSFGRVWRTTYDGLGRVTERIDPASRTNSYEYDGTGNLLATTLPGNRTATYTRDAMGQLASITEPSGGVWTFGYSSASRMTNQVDPLMNNTVYTYTPCGNVESITYPDAGQRLFDYDVLGRITNISAGAETCHFSYDAAGYVVAANEITNSYNAVSAVTQTVSGTTTYDLQWNNLGQLTDVTMTPPGITFTYSYDPHNGLATNVVDSWGAGSVGLAYNSALLPVRVHRANGVDSSFTWNTMWLGSLASLQDGTFTDIQYSYDALGRITNLIGTLPLDVASQLVSETDELGFNAMNQVTNNGYAYSLRGEMTSAPNLTCRWDGFSRMIGVNNTTNRYDGHDRLIKSASVDGAVQYSYCESLGGQIPLRINGTENTYIQAVLPGYGLLYSIVTTAEATNVVYYHYDERGSTIATTDGAGEVSGRYGYSPYGRFFAGQTNAATPFQFLGRRGCHSVEGSDELWRLGARAYHARSGQFISPEPLWPDLVNIERLNVYNYSVSDPINWVDSNGLFAQTIRDYAEYGPIVVAAALYAQYKSEISRALNPNQLGFWEAWDKEIEEYEKAERKIFDERWQEEHGDMERVVAEHIVDKAAQGADQEEVYSGNQEGDPRQANWEFAMKTLHGNPNGPAAKKAKQKKEVVDFTRPAFEKAISVTVGGQW